MKLLIILSLSAAAVLATGLAPCRAVAHPGGSTLKAATTIERLVDTIAIEAHPRRPREHFKLCPLAQVESSRIGLRRGLLALHQCELVIQDTGGT